MINTKLQVNELNTASLSAAYLYAERSNISISFDQIQKDGIQIAKFAEQYIYSPSADSDLDVNSDNAIANSVVAKNLNKLSNDLSAYLQKKGPDQKIRSTPFDILTMIDQAQEGEEGHNMLRDMYISCGEWVQLESKLPDIIDGTLEIANNNDNKLITTTTYLKGN